MSHDVGLNRSIAGTEPSGSRWSVRPPTSGSRSKIIHACPPLCEWCGSCPETTKRLGAAPPPSMNACPPEVHRDPMRVVSTIRRLRRKVRRAKIPAGSWTIRPVGRPGISLRTHVPESNWQRDATRCTRRPRPGRTVSLCAHKHRKVILLAELRDWQPSFSIKTAGGQCRSATWKCGSCCGPNRQMADRVEWWFVLTSAVACVGVHERDPLEQFLESLFELHVRSGPRRVACADVSGSGTGGQTFVALVVPDHVERTEIRAV